MKKRFLIVSAICGAAMVAPVFAEPIQIEVVLAPVNSIKMDFVDGSKHFVLMVHRKGVAEGEGTFSGAKVEEFGWHDLDPPNSGSVIGYLQLTVDNGDIAYLKLSVRGVFMGGEMKGPPAVHGVWELVSGTGAFVGMRGLGSMQIAPAAGPDRPERRFSLQGDIAPKP